MAALSKFSSIKTSCQEYVHPWTDSCFDASYSLMFDTAQESVRIYVTAYLLALLMRGKIPSKKDVLRTCLGILQSTVFLTTHGIGYSIVLCTLRRLIGSFNFFTVSFVPSFLSSIIAILIERPSRRGLLSLYVTNVASETLFRMAVSRKWVKPIRFGEVAIFSVSVALLLYLSRGENSSNDFIFRSLRFVVGPYEGSDCINSETEVEDLVSQLKIYKGKSYFLKGFTQLQNWWKRLVHYIKKMSRNQSCPHPFSCVFYMLQGGGRMFAIGYTLQLCLKILLQIKRILRNPRTLQDIPFQLDTMQLGAFLSTFAMLYRAVSCSLRRIEGQDARHIAIPAGFIAGLSFIFYRGNTIALYFMWKAFQIMYSEGVKKGYFIGLPWASVFFHAFSTAVLFHVAIIEPHNLRPSYWKFLIAVSGGRIAKMDRRCIDVYGLETSKSLEGVLAREKHK